MYKKITISNILSNIPQLSVETIDNNISNVSQDRFYSFDKHILDQNNKERLVYTSIINDSLVICYNIYENEPKLFDKTAKKLNIINILLFILIIIGAATVLIGLSFGFLSLLTI